MRTLIVDDESVSRKKMQKIMSSIGECESVENGGEALTFLRDALSKGSSFDLITLDVSMPEMDGTEVLYKIREMERENKIPKKEQAKIMMVTSEADKDMIITCIQAGCDEYIIKPFKRETVVKKLLKMTFDVS